MDFEDLLSKDSENEQVSETDKLEIEDKTEKIGQNQFYDIITSKKPDWQAIIYELIHSEQLDPWDIDIVVLFDKINLQEATKFRARVSGRVADKIDIQVFNVLPKKIKNSILKNYKILYKK